MLAIELAESQVDEIFDLVEAHPGLTATVNLPDQQVAVNAPTPRIFEFEIDAGKKAQLLEGMDDIDTTLKYEADISRFEERFDPLSFA
jgi:3-isopropylmalate/(R)-2-methylmalate dehydratase small subunit